jgi:hypothetical protein
MAAISMTFTLLSGADAQIRGHPAADLIKVWTKIGNAANMKQYYFCFSRHRAEKTWPHSMELKTQVEPKLRTNAGG